MCVCMHALQPSPIGHVGQLVAKAQEPQGVSNNNIFNLYSSFAELKDALQLGFIELLNESS